MGLSPAGLCANPYFKAAVLLIKTFKTIFCLTIQNLWQPFSFFEAHTLFMPPFLDRYILKAQHLFRVFITFKMKFQKTKVYLPCSLIPDSLFWVGTER